MRKKAQDVSAPAAGQGLQEAQCTRLLTAVQPPSETDSGAARTSRAIVSEASDIYPSLGIAVLERAATGFETPAGRLTLSVAETVADSVDRRTT
jgi:hypothetical protein